MKGGDLRRAVFETIRRELGVAALARFVAENMSGTGNYAKERRSTPDRPIVEIVEAVKRRRAARKKAGSKKP